MQTPAGLEGEKRPLGEEAPALQADLPRQDPRAPGGGQDGFAKPKLLAEARWGQPDPQAVPRSPPSPSVPTLGRSRTPSPPADLARRSWGSRKGDRALAQDVARAPQLRPPGCRGRDAGAGMPVPVPCPCSPLLGRSPGTRINCSCFPSLTALLLAGTNCESPQGPTARPARGVPPAPGLCYPEFRISCSRRVEGGAVQGWGAWREAKRPWTQKGDGALFRLEPQQLLSVPAVPPKPGWPRCPVWPQARAGGPVAAWGGAGAWLLLPRLSGCSRRGGLAAGITAGPGVAPEGETLARSGAKPELSGRSHWILLVSNQRLRLSFERAFAQLRWLPLLGVSPP